VVPAASGRGPRVVAHGEVATYPMPCPSSIHRVWGMSLPVDLPAGLRPIAFHEAGHIVLFRWLGINATRANIWQVSTGWFEGRTHMPQQPSSQLPAPVPNDLSAAVAASAFHAGLMAEIIAHGAPWEQVICKMDSDFRHAEELLAPCFGSHASGAHAFAQRVALHVLSSRWSEVCRIATALEVHGEWRAAE
jgi:hypothetical protein